VIICKVKKVFKVDSISLPKTQTRNSVLLINIILFLNVQKQMGGVEARRENMQFPPNQEVLLSNTHFNWDDYTLLCLVRKSVWSSGHRRLN